MALIFILVLLISSFGISKGSDDVLEELKALRKEVKANNLQITTLQQEVLDLKVELDTVKQTKCDCNLTEIESDIHDLIGQNILQEVNINLLYKGQDDLRDVLRDTEANLLASIEVIKYDQEELENELQEKYDELKKTDGNLAQSDEQMDKEIAENVEKIQETMFKLTEVRDDLTKIDHDIEQRIETMTDLISIQFSSTLEDCQRLCSQNEHCKIFSWHKNQDCLLFSSDEGIDSCPYDENDCQVGSPTIGLLCGDIDYKILDSSHRRVKAENYDPNVYIVATCDKDDDPDKSPDWQGQNWYRIGGDAGSKIADKYVPNRSCGTVNAGWMVNAHPQKVGQITDEQVCLTVTHNHDAPVECFAMINIKVKHCGNFYLYFLDNVPGCHSGYGTN